MPRVRATVPNVHRRPALEVVRSTVDAASLVASLDTRGLTAAAHGPFSGAVVTLLPTDEDAARLAVDGFEPPDALHVTLAWLGDTDDDPPPLAFDDAVETIAAALENGSPGIPVEADAFAYAIFNPVDRDRDPAAVVLVQSDALVDLRGLVVETVGDRSSFPTWIPHLTLAYDMGDPLGDDAVAERMGTITFDRIRVAYGSEQTADIPLGGETMTASTKPRVRAIVPDRYRNGSATVSTLEGETETAARMPQNRAHWEGVLILEDEPTGDGRLMESGSLRWESLPLPLRWTRSDEGEHRGAVTVGRILEVWRDGNEIKSRGDLDLRIDEARELAELMSDDGDGPTVNGVSADLDDVDVEVRVAAEVLDRQDAMFADELGEGETPEREVDDEGRVVVWEFAADDEMMVTTDARIRAATVVDVPAFIGARLTLVDGPDDAEEPLVAATAPQRPPRDWFDDPRFGSTPRQDPRLVTDERTGVTAAPVRITEDGRIFGHIAPWKACHTGFRECVNPPPSGSGYRYFHVGAVETDDGTEVPTGRITLDTLHAGRRLSAVDTLAHYENTGLAVADVVAGEDQHGVWIAGAIRPGVSDEQLRTLRASPLSGDWRRIGGSLELVAALAVNSPGFPVPRALVASGEVVALHTAGTLAPHGGERSRDVDLSDDELEILRRMAARERDAADRRRGQVEQSRRRMLVSSAASTIHGRR